MNILIVFVTLFLIKGYHTSVPNSGPEYKPSIGKIITYLISCLLLLCEMLGKVWPKPKYERGCRVIHFIDPNNFKFVVVGKTCDILEQAIERYHKIISLSVKSFILDIEQKFDKSKLITQIEVNLTDQCEQYPYLYMDEWYSLESTSKIFANSIWGILRALETYSQLVIPISTGMLQIHNIRITDSPRFPHRGLMMDTARHYININTILKILDGMAYNKLNVFHWHIVDDQSFPYQSVKFPELSEKGAHMASMVYTQENILNIIEYARMRGIRIVVEFNVPAHTTSWGYSHPELLTDCGHNSRKYVPGRYVPGESINPISETAYIFLVVLFNEVLDLFKDKFMHIGGDDVNVDCWENNNKILEYSKLHQLKYVDIYNKFINRISELVSQKSFNVIVWEEAQLQNPDLPNETIIQIKSDDWRYSLNNVVKIGYRAIFSSCWDFDRYDDNWDTYMCEPYDFFSGSLDSKKLIIGGEAIMWGKYVSDRNIIPAIFPKISKAAERLWSLETVRNITDAQQRLEEHICRMILRGIDAQPLLGPGFCG